MKHPRLVIAALAFLGVAAFLFAPAPMPGAAAARAGDCLTIHMWSNGYHSDIGVPADALGPGHPLRRLFPEARSLLIGWGERDFYYSRGDNLWIGLDAVIPPSPSVMHVAADAEVSARYLGPNADAAFAISREGAASLAAYLARALVLDGAGAPVVSAPGKVIGQSFFLEGRENFHLFNVCNHWMARALRAAGINVRARDKWLAAPLIEEARRAAPAVCPAESGA